MSALTRSLSCQGSVRLRFGLPGALLHNMSHNMLHLDVFLLDECPHTVLELPGQRKSTLRPALDARRGVTYHVT
jgi:hypothetical protein